MKAQSFTHPLNVLTNFSFKDKPKKFINQQIEKIKQNHYKMLHSASINSPKTIHTIGRTFSFKEI